MGDQPAIVTEGLLRRFGPVRALDGIGLEQPAGTVLGMLGPDGAGKTTTVRILATLLSPDGQPASRPTAQIRLPRQKARMAAPEAVTGLPALAALLSLVHGAMTARAAPTMFQIGRAGDDQAALASLLGRLARWSAARAAAQTMTLIV